LCCTIVLSRDNPLGLSQRDPRCSDFAQFGFYCVASDHCRAAANSTINTSGAGLFEERSAAGDQELSDRVLGKFFQHGRPDRDAVLGLPCGNTVDVSTQPSLEETVIPARVTLFVSWM
jgi:hypothetical protein